jgi:four helix bundle protein
MPLRNYADLTVWQKAMDLAETVYKHTAKFPKEELFGLKGQLRRAAVSVPSNIAEGEGRSQRKPFLQHLYISYGSLREVETQAILAGRLGYLDSEKLADLMERCAEIGKMINGLSKSLKNATSRHP